MSRPDLTISSRQSPIQSESHPELRSSSSAYEVSRGANSTIARLHILSLPKEIRNQIWKALKELTSLREDEEWFTLPRIEFASLSLACRQLHDELEQERPENLIPFGKFNTFAFNVFQEWQCRKRILKYKSITLEFNHNAGICEFSTLASVLNKCGSTVEELRLHFTGSDHYGTVVHLHDASTKKGRVTKLPPDGQRTQEMLPLIYEIARMQRLRILVLSNLNSQLFPMCFKHKPRLEFLHITADPRSAVHNDFNLCHPYAGLLMMPDEYRIRVRALHIDANVMRNAYLIPAACAQTLEHLTWTIPDASLDSNMVQDNLFNHMVTLFGRLALHAKRLTTLRVFAGGVAVGDHVQPYTDLEHALTGPLQGIRSLRDLELHVMRTHVWFGHSILNSLSNELERLYTNDTLVLPQELADFITEKYLTASTSPQPKEMDPGDAHYLRWHYSLDLIKPPFDEFGADWENPPLYHEDMTMWIHPTSYEAKHFDSDGSVVGQEITRYCGPRGSWQALPPPRIIGEDFRRKDYIPLRPGNLEFVFYKHHPENGCCIRGRAREVKYMLLRLNGRLLDRARNKHLAMYDPGAFLRPRVADTNADEDQYRSELDQYTIMLHQIYEVEHTNPRPVKAALEELANSPFRDDARYFGNEEAASKVFEREKVAKPEDLPTIEYPYYWDNESEDQDECYWMCPEFDVPSYTQMRKLD